jgi:hypothetical protein
MKEKGDEKMNRVKTGFILLLILLCSGIGVTAYVNHTSILQYDSFIANQWVNSTSIKFTGDLYSGSTNYTAWIESIAGGGSLTKQASAFTYIVWKDGATYYANSTIGGTNYQNANPTIVLQGAINTVGGLGGGSIFLKDAVYDLTTTLDFKHYDYVTFMGSSWNTILKTNNGTYNAITFNGDLADPNIGCKISDLQIDGGGSKQSATWNQQNGIMTTYTQDSTFERLYIHGMGRTGIYNTQSSHRNLIFNNLLTRNYRYGLSYTSSSRGRVIGNYIKQNYDFGFNWDATNGVNYYTTIADNIFENNTNTDLYVVGGGSTPALYGTISGNTFNSGQTTTGATSYSALKMDIARHITITGNIFMTNATATGSTCMLIGGANTHDIVISNNVFYEASVYAGIQIYGASILISGNNFRSTGTTKMAIDLNDADDVTIIGNKFIGTLTAVGPAGDSCTGHDVQILNNIMNCTYKIGANVLSGITPLIISGNTGFVTENSGTGSIALHAKTATITHGLAITPSAGNIHITWTSSLTNCTSWSVTGIGAAQFTVNLYDATGTAKGPSGTVTFSWDYAKTP